MSSAPEPRLERLDPPAEGVALIELAGELDLAVSAQLRELVEAVTAEAPPLVVLDMAQVGFMDSTMLRELLHAHKALDERKSRLVIAGPQPAVRRLLELTGTNAVFRLTDNREAALQS